MRLMKIPVDQYNNLLTVLELQHYGPMFEYFDYKGRKIMSCYIINNALENDIKIPLQENVSAKCFLSKYQEKCINCASERTCSTCVGCFSYQHLSKLERTDGF